MASGGARAFLKQICGQIDASARVVRSLSKQAKEIASVCDAVVCSLNSGGKILTAGNGGSAAEALHLAEELVGRYKANRRPLPAVALVADCTALTCIGNDFGFDRIFSRQTEALGRPGDVLVLFSTSGTARNLSLAARAARRNGLVVVCILGKGGGPLARLADRLVVVNSGATERIQEAHQVILHLILDSVERCVTGGSGHK